MHLQYFQTFVGNDQNIDIAVIILLKIDSVDGLIPNFWSIWF